VYVAYHMDRQIDPLLPDLGSYEHWRLPQRLISCVFFGILVTIFSALPAISIQTSSSTWPVSKLRLVVIGTTFVVGLTMALVGEFFLVKPNPASKRCGGEQAGRGRRGASARGGSIGKKPIDILGRDRPTRRSPFRRTAQQHLQALSRD